MAITSIASDQGKGGFRLTPHLFNQPDWAAAPFAFSLARFCRCRLISVSSLVFLFQSILSLVLISGFCIAQAAGLDVHLLDAPSFAALFADAFPINAGATFARTRFDNLFLALVSLYLISLSSFAVALFHSLVPLLRGVRQYAKLWVGIAFLSICLWLMLFVGTSTGATGLQKHIIDGDALGYVVLFVFMPMIWIFIASELPEH